MKIIKYFIEAVFIYTFFLIIKILGLKNSRNLFSFIFNKIGPIFKSKKIIDENLNKIINFKNYREKKNIVEDMWSNYGKTFAEYLYLYKFKNNKFINPHIKIKGEEILENVINKKKPVIFVSGHFANYELMAMEIVKKGVNLATIYRPLNNFFLNPFMEYLRRKHVCKNQIKKGVVGTRNVFNYLKKNYSIALMIDQRVSEGIGIPFFGQKALTTTLPAQIALRYKYEIVPIYLSRLPDDNFEMEVFEPIDTQNMEENEKNKVEISLSLNKILEKMILKDPKQWIWTHNRWK
tara:strand:- start:137 stop:1012 length:876 start_codon:yes stop_codon:yes gene_type:complete